MAKKRTLKQVRNEMIELYDEYIELHGKKDDGEAVVFAAVYPSEEREDTGIIRGGIVGNSPLVLRVMKSLVESVLKDGGGCGECDSCTEDKCSDENPLGLSKKKKAEGRAILKRFETLDKVKDLLKELVK